MKLKNILFAVITLLLVSCKVTSQTNRELYEQSMINSIRPDSSKISYDLIQINDSNTNLIRKTINGEEYILVCTWKQNVSFYQKDTIFNTGSYNIWVTTAPELKERIKLESPKDTNLRLLQLLGLPPTSKYSYFVEFWVRPGDLFRPCPDKEIWDASCDLCFPQETSKEHIDWINENRISRYYQCDLYNQYPWGQLGYTYDWNHKNKSHIGLSEFIIDKNKIIYVNRIVTTSEYLR
jgi:hypothetical protein